MNPAHYPAFLAIDGAPDRVLLCEPPHDAEHLRRLLAEHRPDARVVVMDRTSAEERIRELAVAGRDLREVPTAALDLFDFPIPDLSAYGPVGLNRAQKRARNRR